MFRARDDLAGEDEDTKIVGRWEHMQVPGWRRAETVLDPQTCRTWIRGSKGVARKEKPLTASHL